MNRTLARVLCLLSLSTPLVGQQDATQQQIAQALASGRTSLDVDALSKVRDLAVEQTKQHPDHAEAIYQLARVNSYRSDAYAMRHDKKNAERALDESIENLVQSLELNEKSADAHSLLANCYGRKIGMGMPMFTGPKYGPKIDVESRRALEIDPNNPRAHASLGRQYFMAPKMFGGDLDKAIAEFRRAIELDPKSDETFVWLAMALRKKGDAAGAEQAIQTALKLNPGSAFAKANAK
jgi:tetratricopeptide (TPR) repeat protein